MRKVNIHEAKSQLSKLIQLALNGEEVVIAKDGNPLVRLAVCPEAAPRRTLGSARGMLEIRDDFDAPLEDFAEYR